MIKIIKLLPTFFFTALVLNFFKLFRTEFKKKKKKRTYDSNNSNLSQLRTEKGKKERDRDITKQIVMKKFPKNYSQTCVVLTRKQIMFSRTNRTLANANSPAANWQSVLTIRRCFRPLPPPLLRLSIAD